MASQPRTPAGEERRLILRRLVIASVASALAAVIVSQFWIAGTWLAAALTPVFVIMITEALHKPTEVIAGRFTANRTAVLPEGTGAGAPPPRSQPRPPDEPPAREDPPVRVYRAGAGTGPVRPRVTRRKLAVGTVVLTALLAFAIAAFAITGSELVAGGSIGKGDGHTTLFGGDKKSSSQERGTETEQQTAPADGQQQRQDKTQEQQSTETAPQPKQDTQSAPEAQPTPPKP